MLRLISLFLFTQSLLFSCALCVYSSPLTLVSFKVNSNNENIKSIDFKWEIASSFTQQLLDIYDTNLNDKLDNEELELIEDALVNYAEPKNFMTYISYGKEASSNQFLTLKTSKYKMKIEQDGLIFYFTADLNVPLQANYKLYIYVNDEEDYFLMQLNPKLLVFKNRVKIHKKNIDKQIVVFTIDESYSNKSSKNQTSSTNQTSVATQKTQTEQSVKSEDKKSLFDFLQEFTPKVKAQLKKVQEGDMVALVILLFVSFIYGMVHAIGPGHGKALAFSYFTSHKSSFFKAFLISLGSSFVHIIGALVLVLISLFILDSFFNSFVNDWVKVLTQISASMIILLAGYLLFNALKNRACACNSCQKSSRVWSVTKPNTSTLKTKLVKKDLYFVLTAGLVPCPGTVVLFIYAFVLKTYFAVFLAAIFISLGMAIVISASSFLGVAVQSFSEKSYKYRRFLEILSPFAMLILGALLLFSVV